MSSINSTSAVFPDGIPVTRETVIVGNGPPHQVELPQRYYDWSFIMAHFPASSRPVRNLVPAESLQPVELVPGISVVTLAAFEYRRMATLQPYNEVAIMVPVRYEPSSNVPLLPLLWPDKYEVGFWVHHLPVTTQEARDVGIGVWGLPKVVAKIEFGDVGWTRRCELRENGHHVLTLSSAAGETRAESRRFYAYSIRDGVLLRSLVETRAQYYAWNVPGAASFTLGRHPVAQELKELGMRNLAVAGLYASAARSRLYPGTLVSELEPTADYSTT